MMMPGLSATMRSVQPRTLIRPISRCGYDVPRALSIKASTFPAHVKSAKCRLSNTSPLRTLSWPERVPKQTLIISGVRCMSDGPSNKQSEESSPSKKPILQQTVDIQKQLKARVTQNLTYENIYNLPNILTVSRLIATPIVGYLIIHESHLWATGLLFYAGLTDLVDGWIARRWKLQTVVGSVIDPMADKTLMAVLTVCLAVQGGIPVWLATLILGRDVSLAIAAIYYRYASLPAPKTLTRYWDFSLPSAEVHPTGISKFNTFLQLVLLGAATSVPVLGPGVDGLLQNVANGSVGVDGIMTAAQYIVAATTAWSGASYLWTKNAVKILGDGTPEQKKRILVKGRVIIGASFVGCAALALLLESQ